MKWIFPVVILFLCVISGLLGLTAGINLNPQSTVKFVPAWGSLGDWVAGTGALLAVAVTLWQIQRQQEREKPKLTIQQHYEPRAYSLVLVSTGLVPATVLGASLSYDHGNSAIDLSSHLPEDSKYPQRLDRGEVMSLLELKNVSFSMLARSLIRPILNSLQAQGIEKVIYGKGINTIYFDRLNSIESGKAVLLVKTAQSTEKFAFSEEAFHALLRSAIDDEFKQAQEKINSWRAEAAQLLAAIAQAQDELNTTDSKAK